MIDVPWPDSVSSGTQRRLQAAAWSMAAVVGLGPLELRHATVRIAGLTVSSVELLASVAILCGAMAVWGLRREGHLARRLTHPLMIALAAWAALHLASALWSNDPLYSLKFGLRVTGGVALAVTCSALGHLGRFRRIVTFGLLAGLAMITALAIAERGLGRTFEPVLQLFRDEPTWMLGEPRLSTVFYHANTLAAYLELALPFLLVAPWLTGLPPQRRWALLLWTAAGGAMLSLTYSRAGLLAGVLASLVLAATARRTRTEPRLARAAFVFAGLLSIAFLANPDMRARLGMGKREYRVRYEFGGPCEGPAAGEVQVPLTLTNVGEWPISDRHAPGEVGYLIWPREGEPVARAFRYRKLPALRRGDRFETVLDVHLPDKPGPWSLVVDIRRKGVIWLSAVGTEVGRTTCTVQQGPDSGPIDPSVKLRATSDIHLQHRPLELARRHYWQAALRLLTERPWLGHGADRYRMSYGRLVPAAAWDGRARAHSVILETAADLGLLGLLVLGLLIGSVAACMRPNLMMAAGASRISTAAAIALVGFGLHSLVDYFLGYTQILLVVWPIVGLATAATNRESAR